MKKSLFTLMLLFLGFSLVHAQTWDDLSKEEKMMKAKKFVADNHNYMRNTLELTDDQIDDVDNVNACYLSTLDRINRYAQTDETKMEAAKAVTAARSVQLDAIMGTDKRDQFMEYVADKLIAEE